MPHIIIKMLAGRSRSEKKRLADRVTLSVMNALGSSESSISVAIEDVAPGEWTRKVYEPDIAGQRTLYKKPGYDPF